MSKTFFLQYSDAMLPLLLLLLLWMALCCPRAVKQLSRRRSERDRECSFLPLRVVPRMSVAAAALLIAADEEL